MLADNEERPLKRQKLEEAKVNSLPQDILLLSLPHILAHPPTHRNHTRSVYMSILALRRYLSTPNLDQNLECRAWTELAEAGFRLGLETPGIENEVERAITKALMISTKHPSLKMYKPQLTHLSARLAIYHGNVKLAQNTLKKVMNNFIVASDPPHILYTAHLAYIDSLSANVVEIEPTTPKRNAPQNTGMRSVGAIRELHRLAMRNSHRGVALFAMVLELLDFVQNGVWNRVEESLRSTEKDLDIATHLLPDSQAKAGPPPGKTNIEKVLIVHVLVLGVLYHTYIGDYPNSQNRLKILHDMLDGGALEAFGPSGIVDIELSNSPQPLQVQVTHPRIIYGLGFLVSSISKRDPVGRKPKRRVYANEGIISMDKELKKEVILPIWASRADVKDFQERILLMKADMTCELIGIAISRSEFNEAEQHISQLIADTRSCGLFPLYSARITLHHAHLAHSQGLKERALKCYKVAAHLSRARDSTKNPPKTYAEADQEEEDAQSEDLWINVSARAGELWLRIGMISEIEDEVGRERQMELLRPRVAQVVKQCQGLGGALQSVGEILSACSSKEYLVTKTHLRTALNLSTAAQDNYLRALVLALVAAQYVHTSVEHAETMLGTAEQLAAGLGALPKAAKTPEAAAKKELVKHASGGDGIGNAHLRLWIGERSLELKRRAADERGTLKQINMNKKFRDAVTRVEKRKFEVVE